MTITKLLVANRAEIAARVIRTAQAMDIATVAVFSDPDADLPFVRAADEAVRLPGATPAETYLDGEAIVDAARRTGADAVHPGYGFLSENAPFARRCRDAGLTFVGPAPDTIEAMGSKTAAKALMAAAGVPVLPGAVFEDTAEPSPTEISNAADAVGFPVLVKAAFGGGGRGMRIASTPEELVEAVASARREATAAFGNGTVFLERYVDAPRHIEVQILGDAHGTVTHLFERECSIQRRYQKIIEEAPSPAVTGELRDQLCQAAVAAGRAIGYVGAGTVEFVLDATGHFYFLEVNTRLQVEHPVTELITGLDLVRLQLEVAEGKSLPPEVLAAEVRGHAIEVRLYAEDVLAGFLPVSGDLHTFEIPRGAGLRVDAGFASGTRVSTFYDSMLAKVIAYGDTRDDARRALGASLSRAKLHGVETNRDLLVGILREAEFAEASIDTGYLTRHPAEQLCGALSERCLVLHALSAAIAGQARSRADARVLASLPSGWRNNPSARQNVDFLHGETHLAVTYRFERDGLQAAVNGQELPSLVLHHATPTLVDLEIGGVRRQVEVKQVGDVAYVDSALGHTALVERPRFPDPGDAEQVGSLRAPMPGTVVRVEASVGERVEAGATIVAIEAMKMEHAVRAPVDGLVTALLVEVGHQVDTGAPLAVVEDEAHV
ncbi:biotin carboxylase N-terminal domain-containing protein [Humibacter sp.]|uniref:ATP-binding protein n=1 Tax=Humibacter sp. TaxID=1940291 RepID=UPI002B5E7AAA|nr:biotin carboxylase N-terminal domain-containing protein [Humibacter sp.]HVX09189.1 biotin carboxylase N-terminal domain-containing protein [Humibacter sp.]